MSSALRTSLLFALLVACAPVEQDEVDVGLPGDAGDAGHELDAGDPVDAGEPPVTVPLSGFGSISGECGVLDDELTSATNHVVRNHIDFAADPFDASDKPRLTPGGLELLETPNAGGSSVLSEVFAFEILRRCELAILLKTETDVHYDDPSSKITDILVGIDGVKVGVSVTRAVSYPREAAYPVSSATTLLTKKLEGIQSSTLHVVAEDRWVKQILHVIAYGPEHADAMETAWAALDASLRGDTILVLSVSDGSDEFIYSNQF